MRIAGGEKKGRRLASVPDTSIRPTSDKVRAAVFNVLGQAFVENEAVLDVFAGTGAMGIEALSRGARKAVFIDSAAAAAAVIEKNLKACGLSEKAVVIKADALRALKRLAEKGEEGFDIVFIDAPYAMVDETISVVSEVAGGGLLKAGAVVVCEAAKKSAARIRDFKFAGINIEKEKTYGDTTVFFFTLE